MGLNSYSYALTVQKHNVDLPHHTHRYREASEEIQVRHHTNFINLHSTERREEGGDREGNGGWSERERGSEMRVNGRYRRTEREKERKKETDRDRERDRKR